jgi:hypothetical protein
VAMLRRGGVKLRRGGFFGVSRVASQFVPQRNILFLYLIYIIKVFTEERKESCWVRGQLIRCYLALPSDACSWSRHMSVKAELMASWVARPLPHLNLVESGHSY